MFSKIQHYSTAVIIRRRQKINAKTTVHQTTQHQKGALRAQIVPIVHNIIKRAESHCNVIGHRSSMSVSAAESFVLNIQLHSKALSVGSQKVRS